MAVIVLQMGNVTHCVLFIKQSLLNHPLIHEMLKFGTFKFQYIVLSFKQNFDFKRAKNIPFELNSKAVANL